jgi:hypothetical protein
VCSSLSQRWLYALGAIVWAVLFASNARASEPLETASLTYTVQDKIAAKCPDEESFRRKVAARLGYQPFVQAGRHRVSVEVKALGSTAKVRAEVVRSGQSEPGVRALEGDVEKCEPLVAALATAVALALDPVRSAAPVAAEPVKEPVPPPPTQVAVVPVVVQPTETKKPEAAAVPWHWFGAASGIASVGVLPAAAVGGEFGFGARVKDFSLELAGRAELMPSAVRVASGDRLEATAYSALVVPCANLSSWLLCGSVRIGAIQGRAPDVVNPSLGTSVFGAAGARAGYNLEVSRIFSLRILGAVEIPIVRTSLVVDRKAIWTASPVAAGLELGLVVWIP